MGMILNMLLLSIGSIYGSVYLNKRYEEMLPLTVMGIILILFIFYMLNIVLIGYYLILLIALTIIILSLRSLVKNKIIRKSAISNFFTPGFLIFIVLFFIIFTVTKDNYVMLFDELRLWALYPKSIFITNKLMLGEKLFFSTDYYPGMPLFQYFFAKNVGYFSEGHLFLSYALVCLSFIMPISKKIKWNNFWAIIPMIILLFTFPMLFANSGFDSQYYYRTLYIDAALGISFGYSLYLSTQDVKNDKLKYILFCFSLTMIILMKVVGVALAGCVLLSYLVNQILIYKSYDLKLKKENIKNYFIMMIPFIVVIFTFLSWQFVIKINTNIDSTSAIVSSSRMTDALSLFLKPNIEQKEFTKSYISYIRDNTLIINNSKYSNLATLPNLCILYFIIMLILFFSVVKDSKKILISGFVFGIISIIIFLMLYLYVYVFTFNNTILCYGRYIGTVICGISIFILLLTFELSSKIKNKPLYYFLISCLILLYFYNIPKVNNFVYEPEVETKANEFSKKIVSILGEKNDNLNILTLYNYCDALTYSCVLYQHHLFLSLVDYGIYPYGMYLSSVDAVPPEFYIPINHENIKLHSSSSDYVFVVEDVENIQEEIKELFGDYLKAGDLFQKIIDNNGNISMKKISS